MPTPAISMFRNSSSGFTLTYSASGNDKNIRTDAVAAGWNATSKLVVNIDSGVVIGATTTASALDTGATAYPGGLFIYNSGTIQGIGGAGGKGVSLATNTPTVTAAIAGTAGGTAFRAQTACTLINNSGASVLGGGGGGGGGGGAYRNSKGGTYNAGGGGGGGGRGTTGGVAGAAGTATGGLAANSPGTIGTAGSNSAAGAGGAGGNAATLAIAGAGGTGGAAGTAGSTGSVATSGTTLVAPAAGGAAGNAINGIANVTLTNNGTITGPQV